MFKKLCRDAVEVVFEPVEAAPFVPLTMLLNDEVKLAVVALLLAPLDPSC